MSDTPETDNLARGNHVVPTEWAEQLEKERNAWKEIAEIRNQIAITYQARAVAAPPAQTPPPRLTDEQIEECDAMARQSFRRAQSQVRGQLIMPSDGFDWHFASAIETAVRKQFGIKDQEGGAA